MSRNKFKIGPYCYQFCEEHFESSLTKFFTLLLENEIIIVQRDLLTGRLIEQNSKIHGPIILTSEFGYFGLIRPNVLLINFRAREKFESFNTHEKTSALIQAMKLKNVKHLELKCQFLMNEKIDAEFANFILGNVNGNTTKIPIDSMSMGLTNKVLSVVITIALP